MYCYLCMVGSKVLSLEGLSRFLRFLSAILLLILPMSVVCKRNCNANAMLYNHRKKQGVVIWQKQLTCIRVLILN